MAELVQMSSSTYLMIPNEEFQMLHWFELFSLEDGWVRQRVGNQVLCRDSSDLGVWMGDEANELGHMLAISVLHEIQLLFSGEVDILLLVLSAWRPVFISTILENENYSIEMGYMSVSRGLERMALIVKYFGGAAFDGF